MRCDDCRSSGSPGQARAYRLRSLCLATRQHSESRYDRFSTSAQTSEPDWLGVQITSAPFLQDVKYPYIICTAAFPDAHKQAVYAQVTGRDLQGERAASCVIDAPELPSGVHSVDARIKTSGAPGPRGNLQAGDEYLMQFIQPPTVLNSELQYEESEYSGYTIRVSLQNAHGVKKVTSQCNLPPPSPFNGDALAV